MSEMFSRRSFLKMSGAVVAAGALAACSGSSSRNDDYILGGSNSAAEYYDVGGLLLKKPDSVGCLGGKFYIDLDFKNPSNSPVVIDDGDSFKNCNFNGTYVRTLGFRSMTFPQRFYTIEPTGPDESQRARLYFNNSFTIPRPRETYSYSFDFIYNRRKAICEGEYHTSGGSTSQVTVKDVERW